MISEAKAAELAALDGSFAAQLIERLLSTLGLSDGLAALDALLSEFSTVELAALEYDWSNVWARPKQIAPDHDWQWWGHLCGRGAGKTLSVSKFVNEEVEAGRATLIGLAAQDEDNSIKLQITGPSGLIATAPPWCKPEWHVSDLELVWPNGAKAFVRTPEVPGKIRGFDYHLSWLTELQSWPASTRDEAYMNFLLATRLGYARLVWDATPKKRHPLLRKLLRGSESDPSRYVVVRGQTRDNILNLGAGYVEKLEAEIGGTQQGREELLGEMLDDSENALVKNEWIEAARRPMPEIIVRRVIGIDPAVTNRAGNDRTGVVEEGLGADGQVYVLGDHSGRHSADAWAGIVLDAYVRNGCDCVVVETNKGGDLVTQNLRAHAGKRGLTVVVLGREEKPHRANGVVYVREVHARGAKEDRAQPLATAYERGRISHVIGVDLSGLEEVLTTWEPAPGQRSPDALDAHVHAATELLGLALNKPDPKRAFQGIELLGAMVSGRAAPAGDSLATLLGGGDGGGRLP